MIKVAFVKSNGEVSSVVSPNVDEAYPDGQIYGDCVAKHISHESNDLEVIRTWVWDGEKWITREPKPSESYVWKDMSWQIDIERRDELIRTERNLLLAKSDWTQLPDSPLTDQKKQEWADYRQALRDMMSQDEPVFPEAP